MTNETDRGAAAGAPQVSSNQAVPAAPKARRPQRGVGQQLADVQLAVGGVASDALIQELFGAYGLSLERITRESNELIAQVRQRMHEQSLAAGDVCSAKEEYDRVYGEIYRQHVGDVAVARALLRNNRAALQKLGLHVRRKKARASWMLQARQFYSMALEDPEIHQRLAGAELTRDRLEGALGLLSHLEHCLQRCSDTRGAYREATRRRTEAVKRLAAWMSNFRGTARLALRGQPLLLAKLGF
jgi:hypothetical protein